MKPTTYLGTALLALVLSACGVTPDAQTNALEGVDEYGPYKVVARSDEDTLQTQGWINEAEELSVELRQYSDSRYGASLYIVSRTGAMSYKGTVSLANYSLSGSRLNIYSNYHSQTVYKPVGMGLGGPIPKSMSGPRVCALADGTFRNDSGDRYERTDSYLRVCVRK